MTAVITFGEAMIRYTPLEGGSRMYGRGQPSACATFMRSVGGDELNVAVALSKLGRSAEWVSVLPVGPMGDVVRHAGTDAGVKMDRVRYVDNGILGSFTMLPDQARVVFERNTSSFAKQEPGWVDWVSVIKSHAQPWIHATGIAPMCSDGAFGTWNELLKTARDLRIPVSFDVNHRAPLGSFEKLWSYIAPHLDHLCILIFSRQSLVDVAKVYSIPAPSMAIAEDDADWVTLMRNIHAKLGGPAIACCFKHRTPENVQTRWSVVVDGNGVTSTAHIPVIHVPKDECGGGSAWAAGLVDAWIQASEAGSHPLLRKNLLPAGCATTETDMALSILRQADALAALAQESAGDHSTVTRSELVTALEDARNKVMRVGEMAEATAAEESKVDTVAVIHDALERMKAAKVTAILRAKNSEVAMQRGVELVGLGCKALEITVDSVNFEDIASFLVRQVGDKCLIGAGTLMSEADVAKAAAAGCRFAMSPVNPFPTFVESCHKAGILAVPAAFSPQEIMTCFSQGALVVKLFPAQLWQPAHLKALLDVGPFRSTRIIPSGGINATNAQAWLDAGAWAVGMGSNLVGGDVSTKPDAPDVQEKAAAWVSHGRAAAQALFTTMNSGGK